MAQPKHRHSKQRTRKRRTHHALRAPGFSECSTCHMPTIPHRVCPHCGSYNGVEVVKVKTGTGT